MGIRQIVEEGVGAIKNIVVQALGGTAATAAVKMGEAVVQKVQGHAAAGAHHEQDVLQELGVKTVAEAAPPMDTPVAASRAVLEIKG